MDYMHPPRRINFGSVYYSSRRTVRARRGDRSSKKGGIPTRGAIARPASFAALGALFLGAGAALGLPVSLCVFVASLCVSLSVEKGGLRGGALACLAIGLLGLFLTGFNLIYLMPYLAFMGPHPIVSRRLARAGVRRLPAYLLMQLWYIAAIFASISASAAILSLNAYRAFLLRSVAWTSWVAFFFYSIGMERLTERIRPKLRIGAPRGGAAR